MANNTISNAMKSCAEAFPHCETITVWDNFNGEFSVKVGWKMESKGVEYFEGEYTLDMEGRFNHQSGPTYPFKALYECICGQGQCYHRADGFSDCEF